MAVYRIDSTDVKSNTMFVVKQNDIDFIWSQIDQVSKDSGADSIFEFAESAANYHVVYNYETFSLMVTLESTLYDFRVSTSIGLKPVFSDADRTKSPSETLRNTPPSTLDSCSKALDKQKEINGKLEAALNRI